VVGPRVLHPTNIAWLDNDNMATCFLGWHVFRNSPWSFPIGLNPQYGLELSNSIVMSDSNPFLHCCSRHWRLSSQKLSVFRFLDLRLLCSSGILRLEINWPSFEQDRFTTTNLQIFNAARRQSAEGIDRKTFREREAMLQNGDWGPEPSV